MTGLLIGVIGLIATAISIYLTILFRKSPKRPCKLKYLPTENYNVFNYHSDVFNKFDIKYDNNPISDSICYISGKLLCDGQDINSNNNQIKIELPDGYQWIDLSLQTSDEMIKVEIDTDSLNRNVAILSFKELRNNEYIIINAIIQGKPIPLEGRFNFQKMMRFSHHITNTEEIKVESLKQTKSIKSILIKNGLIALFVLSVLFTAFLFQVLSIDVRRKDYGFVFFPLGSLLFTACIWYYMACQFKNNFHILKKLQNFTCHKSI